MNTAMVRYVGLDVHKRVVQACIVDQAGKVVHRERFALCRRTLETFAMKVLRPTDHVALEATTNCWAVADVLRPCVARVVVSKAARTVGYFYFDPNLGNLGAVRFQGVSRHRGISMVKLDEFVTIKQAAKLLGVSANTLRNWHRDAKIPVYRNPVSGYRLFKKADLDELLRKIEESGKYPSGWSRPQQSPRHPR